MDGWARRFLLIAPDGLALPCHAAHRIPGIAGSASRTGRWRRSGGSRPASTPSAARRGCPSRAGAATGATIDFGGCRCQAYFLTGDAAATDPVCSLAPRHDIIEAARAEQGEPAEFVYRSARGAS